MDQHPPAAPPPPPPHPQPPPPQTVFIHARPGGFWRGVAFVAAVALFGIVFIGGLVLGAVAMLAGSSVERIVLEQNYRDGAARQRDKIAIIPVEGIIIDRQAQVVRAAVDHVLDDRRVRAVILRVDSPGGAVAPSDQVWAEVRRLRESGLPVIASFGGLAASGGYYISAGADTIIAEETTITGSIGVIAQILTMEELMDKIGIQPVTLVATGSPEKDVANNIFRQWNERDRERVLAMLDNAYETFHRRVRDGRGQIIPEGHFDAVADGSIFSAAEALENGLIDGIGYLDDAVDHAERAAGLRPGRARVVRLIEPPSLFGNGLLLQGGMPATIGSGPQLDADTVRGFVNELGTPRVMYLMR